ncbi:unnamed protein product [Phyllotreta striolata]|uniref:Uncharacterized protein n=1 Tax=Phyllotreta striolata TaxID=444603 RepID=A0A9N9TG67_PHYSR|nr:unnamed protein product [Phyllotreta striolata]
MKHLIPATFWAILLQYSTQNELDSPLSRQKRYLLFPPRGGTNIIQLIIGLSLPVEVSPESVTIGWDFRAFYVLPTNLSELQYDDYGTDRQKRHISRWNLYEMLEHEAHSRGYDGRSCVLKSICQASDTPLNKQHGLFEEIFHTIFTPTSTDEELDRHTDNEYFAARLMGKRNRGKCDVLFPECEVSLMDLFSYSLD